MGKFIVGGIVVVFACLMSGIFPHVAVALVAIIIVGMFLIFGTNQ